MNEKIPIGKLICKRLNEERRSASWLAEKICCSRTTVYKIFQKTFIDTELLLKISTVLEYDFFSYYSNIVNENKSKKS